MKFGEILRTNDAIIALATVERGYVVASDVTEKSYDTRCCALIGGSLVI